jgi:hypothetical protein
MKHMNFRSVRTALLLATLTVLAGGAALRADDSKLLNKDELRHLIATAETPQDHERLAAHFTAKAEQLDAEAKEHMELAADYKTNPNMHEMKHPMSAQTAGHCDYFAKSLTKAAQDARKLAVDHEAMAKQAAVHERIRREPSEKLGK